MKRIFISIILLFFIGFVSATHGGAHTFSGYYSSGNFITKTQYQPSFQTYYGGRVSEYWPILGSKEGQEQCEARQDLMIQVAPAGCQPAVVRSDLLAEQNVPVFCQLDAFKLNPLIDINEIKNIRFKASYPKEIIGTGFHPARAALRTKDKLLGSPLTSNIGYAVVILKKNENESSLPNFVNLTLSAQVEYESGNALGIGKTEFLLSEVSDETWDRTEKNRQSFWQGRYSLRLENVEPEFADVSIYRGDLKVASTRAEIGKTTRTIYLPGSYCRAGLQVAYDGFIGAKPSARLEIGDSYGLDLIDVQEGSNILNGRCKVNKLEIDKNTGSTGKLKIQCSYSEGVELALKKRTIEFVVGDEVNLIGRNNKDVWKVEELLPNGKYRIKKAQEEKSVTYGEIVSKKIPEDEKKYNDDMEMAFKEAIDSYERVAEEYTSERIKDNVEKQIYGEMALQSAIDLAEQYGKGYEEARLIGKFLEIYKDSNNSAYYNERLRILNLYDTSFSSGVIYLDGKYRTIRLVDLKNPAEESFANFFMDQSRSSVKINLNEEYKLEQVDGDNGKSKATGRIIVDDLTPESVKLSAYCNREISGKIVEGSRETHILKVNEDSKDICNRRVKLDSVNVKEIAKVRLIPYASGVRSEVNVSLGIGIEKRAIKLNPAKTKEKIENINKSIEKFEKLANGLGKTVETLKGICFATAGVLTAKNFLTSLKGESIARQQVMRGEYGWTQKCNELVKEGKYSTLDACYLGEADNINRDVKIGAESIRKVNEKIKDVEKDKITSGGFLGERNVDTNKSASEYARYLVNTYGSEKIGDKELKNIISKDCYDKFECDYTMLRNIEQNILAKRQGVSENIEKNINLELDNYKRLVEDKRKLSEEQIDREKLKAIGLGEPTTLFAGNQQKIIGDVQDIDKASVKIKDSLLKENKNLKHSVTFNANGYSDAKRNVKFNGGSYVAGLEQTVSGEYVVRSIAMVDNKGEVVEILDNQKVNEFVSVYNIGPVNSQAQVSYSNKYIQPKIRYYENEPYKGMPAIVPFDTTEGWYAATKQTLPVFGGIGGFESSGRVSSFWLCNVGKNGREQFHESNFGDDVCQLVNLNTGQSLGVFPGLSEQKAKELVGKAIRALSDAASQYGQKPVRIGKEIFNDVNSAPNIPEIQCQDYMDPKDCHKLFNVCDPVICPASRCDFGGKYPVADVVQTGLIGSSLLCLPNAREKIYVPVCLTGIHAGLESYVSILKSHRQCLQENIDSGKTIGICDQITSVYMCEFMWRQGAPIAKVLLPKLVEFATTGNQGARGGGEYLTVAGAWNNAQSSVKYFTQQYGVNALKAYRVRSVEEAGSQVCKAFISAKAPTKFKSLIKPDSPPQFYAWFSSIKYSDATVPATAQYKVFYHIFAGKDSGVYYRVYLKNPPQTDYYYSSPILYVASGFITKGEFRTETLDRTAPEGYQELCVDVNGEEKCGFKQVSTDFAINYVRDKVVQNEIEKKGILSEKECISGSPTLRGTAGALLTNTNPQEAVEESINPEIYSRGIVRICATDNPGKTTNPGRYSDVGHCGDERIRCWIDGESVKNSITPENVGVQNETLQNIEKRKIENLKKEGNVLSDDIANANLKIVKDKVESLRSEVEKKKISVIDVENKVKEQLKEIDNLFGIAEDKLLLNHHKAEVLLRKAEIFSILAKSYLINNPSQKIQQVNTGIKVDNNVNKNLSVNNVKNDSIIENKKISSQVISLKDSENGYIPGKKSIIIVDGDETKIYLEGSRVYLDGVQGREEIGSVQNRKITLLESRKRELASYFDMINGTEVKDSESGKNAELVK